MDLVSTTHRVCVFNKVMDKRDEATPNPAEASFTTQAIIQTYFVISRKTINNLFLSITWMITSLVTPLNRRFPKGLLVRLKKRDASTRPTVVSICVLSYQNMARYLSSKTTCQNINKKTKKSYATTTRTHGRRWFLSFVVCPRAIENQASFPCSFHWLTDLRYTDPIMVRSYEVFFRDPTDLDPLVGNLLRHHYLLRFRRIVSLINNKISNPNRTGRCHHGGGAVVGWKRSKRSTPKLL